MILSAPTDGRDASAAIQQALGGCGSGTNGFGEVLHVPPGRYRITRTIRVESVSGIGIVGEGGRSVFQWDGPASGPMLLLSDVRQSLFRDFQIVSLPNRPLAEGVRIENGGGSSWSPSLNHFDGVSVDGTNTGGLGIGFRVSGQGEGGDADNDFHSWHRCVVSRAVRAWVLEPTQSHGLTLDQCRAASVGEVAVDCIGASFHWRGGFIGGAQIAFRTREFVGVPSSIENVSLEGCGRLLQSGGPSGAPYGLTLRGVRFASDALAADGKVIDYRHPGPLLVENCFLGDRPEKPLLVEWNPIADSPEVVPTFRITDTVFRSSRGGNLFKTRRPTTIGCSVRTPQGASAI